MDEKYMKMAVEQAQKAFDTGEVPIGCVIVYNDEVIGKGFNKRNKNKTVLAHAEIEAIDSACKVINDWRLEDCVLYVTVEPCPMCAGAILQSRIKKVVFGTRNPKAGCCGSILNIVNDSRFNHIVEIEEGVLADECSDIMKKFFKEKREEGRKEKEERRNKLLNSIDYTLYVITDRNIMYDKTIEEFVEKAIKGGAGIIQLREKNTSEEEFIKIAKSLKGICTKYDVPLIINDNVRVMQKSGADGVHIGQKDGNAANIRKLIGREKILGISTATVQEAVKAEKDGADYIGVGAMFSTSTKTDTRSVSKQTLAQITKSVNIPVVIIGGIKADNVGEFAGLGMSGAAVVSAVAAQEDAERAAREMYEKIRLAKH